MTARRVVVTGLGAVTPAGLDVPATWASLVAGRSAVERLALLETEGCRCRVGAVVRDVAAPTGYPGAHRLGRSTQFALAAAAEAWRDAALPGPSLDAGRSGVILGTGFGDGAETFVQTQNYLRGGVRAIHPGYVAKVMANAATAHVSLALGLRGPSFQTASACAASAHAIGVAMRLIRCGDADVMVAGGAEEISCILAAAAFDGLRALTTRNDDPHAASRPFDRGRDGFVIGEGAGVVVLEEREHARHRGARIYAELAGVGMAGDAHHLVAPDPDGEGATLAMRAALRDADRAPRAVRYINAHGTSTPLNDAIETRAIHRVLDGHARHVAVSATKSMIGHTLGASAGIGLIATVLAIRDGVVHPTINYAEPDPACDLDYVPNQARPLAVDFALVNAFAFGGHCVSLAVAAA